MKRFGLLLMVVGSVGCVRTLQASTTQPNPMVDRRETSLEGRHLHIDFRDMDLPKAFYLRQTAWFFVANPSEKDGDSQRLRFHVDLVHKWEEIADPRNWQATLQDDQGHVYHPVSTEQDSSKHVAHYWDAEKRMALKNHWGDVIGTKNNPNCECQEMTTLSSVDVFRGDGAYEFVAPHIVNKDVRWLRLTMKNKDIVYQFTWNFSDQLNPDETTEPIHDETPNNEVIDPTFILPEQTTTANVL